MDIDFCLLDKILIPIFLLFLYFSRDEDFLSSENKTKGGFKDKDAKELTVFPINMLLSFIVITATPVGNAPRAFLKIEGFVFFYELEL